jgi:DNA mismatch repair protein MutS2
VQAVKDRIEAARVKRAADSQAAQLRRKSAALRQAVYGRSPGPGTEVPPSEMPAGNSEEIREGDRVKIQSLDRHGIVESIREGAYVVIVGSLRYRAEREDLTALGPGRVPPSPATAPPPAVDDLAGGETATEIKVIGLTADEAIERVDKFLDQAFLQGVESIRIIHGHGKGILRRAISEFLSNHPQVERFSLAPPAKGGGGATLVELKK